MKPPRISSLASASASSSSRSRVSRTSTGTVTTAALLAAMLVLALPAARAGAQNSEHRQGEAPIAAGRAKSPADPIQKDFYTTWLSLAGTYEAKTQTGDLKLVLTANPEYRLFLDVTGTEGGEKVLQRGWIDLFINAQTYDKQLTVTYRPETLGKQFGCTMKGVLVSGGLTAETGASDCSFPLHEQVAKWKLEATPSAIIVTDSTGETTRFERISAR